MPISVNPSTGPMGLKLKAWAQFVGVAANGAATIVKQSGGITSVTRSGASAPYQYDFVFATPMATATYVVKVSGDGNASGANGGVAGNVTVRTVNGCSIIFGTFPGTASAVPYAHVEFWE